MEMPVNRRSVFLCLAAAVLTSCVQRQRPADVEAPAATRPATTAVTPADNFYCLTCHMNFQREELAANHQKNGVGCASCHGESDKHSSDENGIIPPDIMYPREAVNPSCMICHPREKLLKVKGHEAFVVPTTAQAHVCTDCHGKHTMPVRTRRWDKKTGKLIADDGVRMVHPEGPTTRP